MQSLSYGRHFAPKISAFPLLYNELESDYRALFEYAPIGLVILDNMRIIKDINIPAANLFGRTKRQMKNKALLSFISERDRDKALTYLSRCRHSKRKLSEVIHLLRVNKEPLPVQLQSFPMIRKPGSHLLRLALLDISEQSTAELVLKKSYSELEQRVMDRTIALERSNQELAGEVEIRKKLETTLRERMEELNLHDQRRNQFLAMLSHELRNPLGAITNAAEIIRRKGAEDPSLLIWSYKVIRNQSYYLCNILRDLLDISRITLGKILLSKERVYLQTLVERAIESNRAILEENQNNLSLVAEPTPITLEVDPTRCVQIIGNLIHNAAKFSEIGGDIQLKVYWEPGWGVIRVRDFGAGIPHDRLDQVFDLFYQTDDISDGAKGGLGIGLALARQLTELQGGRIEVHCEGLGKGTEFKVWLPAIDSSLTA